MFGKTYSEVTKNSIYKKMSKIQQGVGIFDLNVNLIQKFDNNIKLAEYLKISKITVIKYLNNQLIYKGIYRFKPIGFKQVFIFIFGINDKGT